MLGVFNIVDFVRVIKIQRKEDRRKKLLVFTLPSKTTMREIKLTTVLASVVVCHIILNLPQVYSRS